MTRLTRRRLMAGTAATMAAYPLLVSVAGKLTGELSEATLLKAIEDAEEPIVFRTRDPLHYGLRGREIFPIEEFDDYIKYLVTQKHETRVIAQDEIGHGKKKVLISTVFLGIDHGYTGNGPVLFETMIFGGKYSDYQKRYATYDEAEAGHAWALKLVQGKAARDDA